MLGDPEQIRQVQRRLAADADHARWLARRVAQVGDVAWQAPAADAFRGRVADHVGALARCADDLEVAAGRVGVHARAVESARA